METTVCTDLYFIKPLQTIFSKLIVYDFAKRSAEIGVKAINKEIIDLVKKEHPKYVIWNAVSYEFQESTFDIIRKEGTTVVGLFMDDDANFDYSKGWIPYIDYCLTASVASVPKYRELNARVILVMPIMGGIPIDRDWSKIEEKYNVSFVGTKYQNREQRIIELNNKNIPIHVFGRGWGKLVSFDEMIAIFKVSKINLNFMQSHNNKMQLNGRTFEICMAGGFQLAEYFPGIENYFDIDKEIVCFETADEMIDKVIYYLDHEKERRAIAQAGWKRAISEYTSIEVLSRVFNKIEEDITARGKENTHHPPQMEMPMEMRKRFSAYYSSWVKAFSLGNYRNLSRDAFLVSTSYNPFNFWAWVWYITSFLPFFIRVGVYTSGRLCFHGFRHLYFSVFCPYRMGQYPDKPTVAQLLKDIKQSFIK